MQQVAHVAADEIVPTLLVRPPPFILSERLDYHQKGRRREEVRVSGRLRGARVVMDQIVEAKHLGEEADAVRFDSDMHWCQRLARRRADEQAGARLNGLHLRTSLQHR